MPTFNQLAHRAHQYASGTSHSLSKFNIVFDIHDEFGYRRVMGVAHCKECGASVRVDTDPERGPAIIMGDCTKQCVGSGQTSIFDFLEA